MTPIRRVAHLLLTALATLLLAAGPLALLAAHHAHVRVVTVLTRSMRPHYPPGTLVVTSPLPPADVHVGEVVAFLPPPPFTTDGHPVMHRVVALSQVRTAAGSPVPVMRTRGDANPIADPWQVQLPGADLGRVRVAVRGVGWLVAGGPWAVLASLLGAGLLLEAGILLVRRRGAQTCTCAAHGAGTTDRGGRAGAAAGTSAPAAAAVPVGPPRPRAHVPLATTEASGLAADRAR